MKSKYALQLITLFLAVSAAAGCQSMANKMAPAKADEATRGQQEIEMSPENINKKVTVLATQLVFALDERAGVPAGKAKESIFLREPINDSTDSASKKLSLKIEKLSHDISRNLRKGSPHRAIIVSTFVDTDRLYTTNSFGRYLAEELMYELNRRGFAVIETRAAKELMVQPNIGEMALTRNIEELMNKYEADAIVVGTYKRLGNVLTVNSRMIVSENQEVISAANMQMVINEDDSFLKSLFENELSRVSLQSDVEGF